MLRCKGNAKKKKVRVFNAVPQKYEVMEREVQIAWHENCSFEFQHHVYFFPAGDMDVTDIKRFFDTPHMKRVARR